ncbi:Hypothetical protein R9X50_00691200 [Acrodontium crateriforme]|uniref:SCP domain-containing protein n=1 Tax=Acrodontium crateriforme TaxID=150365 RepID=A0AAQ3MBQ1_9PEZI|nr:Hypothetical protein R9X50_00691200 [Acrodontium crateriforme]
MRSAFIAAFAAGAIAVPHHLHKPRALVTDWDIVYVTDIVTVTESAASAPTGDSKYNDYWHWTSQSKPAEHMTETLKPETTTIYVAPTSAPAVSSVVYQAPSSSPAPESTVVYSVPASQPAYSAPAPSQSSAATSNPSAPASDSVQDVSTWIHNQHRANHSAPAIEWDSDLANAAQTTANTCVFAHSLNVNGLSYGQNIAWGGNIWNAHDGWYQEYTIYPFDTPGNGGGDWQHFSQMVWKATEKIGCGLSQCDGDTMFFVCNYAGAGNVIFEGADPYQFYRENVDRPLGQAPCPASPPS